MLVTDFLTGSDTVALTIVATLYQLIRHPQALGKLRAELDAAFSDLESIRAGPILGGCTLLRACIDEAMRLTPAVGGPLPRVILSPGTTMAGNFLPLGTTVGVPAYTLHRNPEHYADPHSFQPERWILSEE